MSFFNGQSIFDRLAATETESSYRKRNQNVEDEIGAPSPNVGTYYTSRSNSNTPRSGTVSSSLFNRLANTETYATASMKGKIPSPPQHAGRTRSKERITGASSPNASFWHRLAYTETFSTAQLKGMNDQDTQSSNSKRKTSNSFFHRMAYSETFATASYKGLVDDSPTKQKPHSPGGKRSSSAQNSFFDRMSKAETYASASIKAVYGYGKSQETPTRKKYASPDVFERLSRTDTKASSLKKSRSWQHREEVQSRYTPRISKTLSSRKQYLSATRHNSRPDRISSSSSYSPTRSRARTPEEVQSVASARSARSLRSEKSAFSARSNIADYAIARRTPTARNAVPTNQSRPFMSRLGRIDSDTSSSPTRTKKPKPVRVPPSSSSSASVRKTTASSTTRKSTTPRTTAAERLRQEAISSAKKNRNVSSRGSSPARSLKTTTTTASASSFTTSSRREVASLSSKSTAARTTIVKKPEPPKPKPPPRPVVQFDSDDDFSYGESEDEDDFDLGGSVNKKDDKKEGEEEKAVPTTPAPSTFVEAPQDILSKSNDRGLVGKEEDDLDMMDEHEAVEEAVENDEYEQAMSVETASIEDILGDADKENDEAEEIAADDTNNFNEEQFNAESEEANEKDLIDFGEDDNDNDAEEKEPVMDDHEEELRVNEDVDQEEEQEEMVTEMVTEMGNDDIPIEELIPMTSNDDDAGQLMNGTSEDPFEEEVNIGYVDKQDDEDELDDILNEPEPDSQNGYLNEAPSPEETRKEDEEKHEAEDEAEEPVNLIESDDDFSYGDETEDEDEDELAHKVDDKPEPEKDHEQIQEESLAKVKEQQRQEELEIKEQQQEEALIDEPQQSNGEHEDEYTNGGNDMQVDEPPKQNVAKSNTIDSLDFLLDASSTIAEEPDEDEEFSDEDVIDEKENAQEDQEMFGQNPYDDGSLIESIIEEEEDEDMYMEEEDDDEPEMEDEEDAEDTLPPLRYKLLISDKYHPEYGLEELYPEDLDLVDSLTAFEEGAISNQEVAVLVIEALFERDFENGDHWEIDQGTARDLEEDEGGGGDLEGCAFVVKRQARLDWNDLYSVAAAKGTIIISSEKDEIKVENYSYFVAG